MNDNSIKDYKAERILKLLFRALKGEALSVSNLANESNISTRSITRDINDLKAFLADNRDILGNAELKYSSNSHCYTLEMDNLFTNKELFALSKVLIGSKAFSHEELLSIIWKLKSHTSISDKKKLEKLISKELFHYTEVGSDCDSVIDNVWKLSTYIQENRAITISYYKMSRNKVKHKIIPLSIMFSEYYFYLIAYKYDSYNIDDNSTPIYFRIDRITDITVHREQVSLTKEQEFNEGLLRKRSQFMWPGPLRRIRFEFTGPSLQAILDRIPTARVIEQYAGKSIIEAEVYGNGIKMFLLSQGSWVKVLSPDDFVAEVKSEIEKMQSLY
ncbi:MAG: WYL domain-containing transcriptional regulator [Lachnospiraceae bacterium]|nr:WYL domain-containing transcriptional regulator [Lachnospiraceae bacterium]